MSSMSKIFFDYAPLPIKFANKQNPKLCVLKQTLKMIDDREFLDRQRE